MRSAGQCFARGICNYETNESHVVRSWAWTGPLFIEIWWNILQYSMVFPSGSKLQTLRVRQEFPPPSSLRRLCRV